MHGSNSSGFKLVVNKRADTTGEQYALILPVFTSIPSSQNEPK